MEVDKQEAGLLRRAIDEWVQSGHLQREQAEQLSGTIIIKQNDRQQVAQYFLFIALFCILMAFGAIFLNEKLLEKIKAYFSWSDMVIALVAALLSVLWFWYTGRKKAQLSEITYEIYMVLGGLALLTSLVYLCKDLGLDKTYTALLSMALPLLTLAAVLLRSRALWIAALLACVGWYGSYSNWQSTDDLFLGMNYPMRYVVLGLALLGVAFLQSRFGRLQFSRRITYLTALFILFTALWGISIFGNYNSLAQWHQVRQVHVLAYSVVFGLAAGLSFFLGVRYKDEAARDFGVIFLLINLYTRYFEYFWDAMNKGLFFLVLAITFGLTGWFLERKSKRHKPL